MFVTIQTISQEFASNGAEYKKVTGITGDGKQTTKNVFDNLKDKWGLLQENKTVEFVMEKKGQFWNVIDIKEAVASSPVTPELPAEQQKIVDEALKEPVQPVSVKEPNPQAVGMITKEIGDMIRAKELNWIFGKKVALNLVRWYRGQVLGITRIECDGKDLPDFEAQ